jgi:hypothetical protein
LGSELVSSCKFPGEVLWSGKEVEDDNSPVAFNSILVEALNWREAGHLSGKSSLLEVLVDSIWSEEYLVGKLDDDPGIHEIYLDHRAVEPVLGIIRKEKPKHRITKGNNNSMWTQGINHTEENKKKKKHRFNLPRRLECGVVTICRDLKKKSQKEIMLRG